MSMAELSRADQVLIATATAFSMPIVRPTGVDRKFLLETIEEVLPHVTRTNGPLGRVVGACTDLVDTKRGADRGNAEIMLRYQLEAFFRDRMAKAHEAWRIEQTRRH